MSLGLDCDAYGFIVFGVFCALMIGLFLFLCIGACTEDYIKNKEKERIQKIKELEPSISKIGLRDIYDIVAINFYDEDQCIICNKIFLKSDIIRFLSCGHYYHRKCIEQLSNKCEKCIKKK